MILQTMVELWLPLSLGATLSWGTGQIVAKRGATVLGPRLMVAIVGLAEAGFFLAVYAVYGAVPLEDPIGGVMGVAAGLVGMLGYVMYYEAIARGTISRIGTITAAYPAITIILALAILAEVMTALQAVGVVLLLGSAIALGYTETRVSGRAAAPIAILVILAFVFWGLWGFLVKIAVERLGEAPIFAYFALSNAIVGAGLLMHPASRRITRRELRRNWIWPALGTTLGAGGVVLFTLAMSSGPAVLVTPVTGAYPVVTVLVAGRLFRERIGRLEILGLLTFLIGLFAVAWI